MFAQPFVNELKTQAEALGFSRFGITGVEPPNDLARFHEWIGRGFAADLWYLTEKTRVEKRGNPEALLPGAKSILVGAISYNPGSEPHCSDAKFARYAWGEDYHQVVSRKLEELCEWMRAKISEPFVTRTYVDTGPILEKSLAERAGIGWIGKNTCVIDEKAGSYLYIGEILTTLDLPRDRPALNRCGTCTRCLDACPTSAIVGPYQLDANLCISYQTIEQRRAEIPEPIAAHLEGWIGGCDICQEVCPWNQSATQLSVSEFKGGPHLTTTLTDAAQMDDSAFSRLFGATSLKRLGRAVLNRNARTVLRNSRRGV